MKYDALFTPFKIGNMEVKELMEMQLNLQIHQI